jgi:hypothetical protein
VTKGVSEKFDEHERDTARRDVPQEIVDGSKRTTQLGKFQLDEIRTESGTRPALTRDLIEKMRSLPHHRTASVEDLHSRPTIELTTVKLTVDEQGQPNGVDPSSLPTAPPPPAMELNTPPPIVTPAPALAPMLTPFPARVSSEPQLDIVAKKKTPIAAWVVGVILAGLVLMIAAAGAVGFFFGRRGH